MFKAKIKSFPWFISHHKSSLVEDSGTSSDVYMLGLCTVHTSYIYLHSGKEIYDERIKTKTYLAFRRCRHETRFVCVVIRALKVASRSKSEWRLNRLWHGARTRAGLFKTNLWALQSTPETLSHIASVLKPQLLSLALVSGYGNIAPRTTLGRIVTLGYAVLGIPLTLVYLSSTGGVLARVARGVFSR